MYQQSLEKYNLEYEKITNSSNSQGDIFELSINFLNTEDLDRPLNFFQQKDCTKIMNRALNSARLYIDELIAENNFEGAKNFAKNAKLKILNINVFKLNLQGDENKVAKESRSNEVINFFEIYEYRIIDREYIFKAKNKIEEIEKKSEAKIYEILTIFVTIISIIFAFVNGGVASIFYFRIPAFILLGITIVGSWWVIKNINSQK